MCLALLGGGGILGHELHDMWAVLIAPDIALADDVHDARQDVGSAAAEAHGARQACHLLFLA